MNQDDIEGLLQDGIERMYLEEYKDVGEGKIYKGQWSKVENLRDGVGIQLWPDGTKYEGMWKKGKMSGKG